MPGDKQVFLYWDNVAEESRDPFLGFENGDPTQGAKKDFEGYLVYRSKDPEFNDIKIITDSKGAPKYWKPLAQFDLIYIVELTLPAISTGETKISLLNDKISFLLSSTLD